MGISDAPRAPANQPAIATSKKLRINRRRLRSNLEGYLFAAPWLIGFFVFTLGPFFSSIWYSLNQWDMVTPMKFVGLQNYVRLFQNDIFWKSVQVTVTYAAMSLPAALALAMVLALLTSSISWRIFIATSGMLGRFRRLLRRSS